MQVGDLITSVNCQTGFGVTNSGEGSLDYNNVCVKNSVLLLTVEAIDLIQIYAGIVGSCAFQPGGW
jgi:hypothetical protein